MYLVEVATEIFEKNSAQPHQGHEQKKKPTPKQLYYEQHFSVWNGK